MNAIEELRELVFELTKRVYALEQASKGATTPCTGPITVVGQPKEWVAEQPEITVTRQIFDK